MKILLIFLNGNGKKQPKNKSAINNTRGENLSNQENQLTNREINEINNDYTTNHGKKKKSVDKGKFDHYDELVAKSHIFNRTAKL